MTAALSHRFASLDGKVDGRFAGGNITVPYPGMPVPASPPGLLHAGTHGATLPGDHIVVSNGDTDGQEPEVHICPHCEKQFGRLCDLNKHAKSHSRPFKCAFQNCKYWSLGWPTAKELERHVNDKHSAAPRTYPCHYQHCSYKSKRESNCKQHMEKTHGWRYVRSKSNARRVSRRVHSQLAALPTFLPPQSLQSSGPNRSSFSQSPRQAQDDFVLFPREQDHGPSGNDCDAPGDTFEDLDDRESQGSDVVIPWTSPDTRLRRRETFLQKFTQRFSKPDDDLPIDPQLDTVGGVGSEPGTTEINAGSSRRPEKNIRTARDVAVSSKQRNTRSTSTQRSPITPLTLAVQQRPVGRVPPSSHSRNSSATVTQSASTPSVPQAFHHVSKTSKRKDDEDREEGRPQKKLKPSPMSDFKDNQMPDIFVAAYPDVYNRETKSLYQSCETEHRDISTLVRHLSRAPHRLHVSERYIHSFDVEPVELCHARRGVCRRCWIVFTDREALESHLSSECEKVSRGKREKWQILYHTFTPLATDTPSPNNGRSTTNVTHNLARANASATDQNAYGAVSPGGDDSPVAPPSPTTVDLGPRGPLELEGEGEVDRLRRENRQLKAIVRVVINQAKGIIDLSRLVAPNLLEGIDGVNDLTPGPGPGRSGRLTFPTNGFVENENPDAAALVGQMNSHPTDVDRQGMMEDIQQTFSRTSSGMSSSDKSTIRHVSNSPPQRYQAYHGDRARAPRPKSTKQSGDPTPTRHQPTSLPDSGYGSDKKRTSVVGSEMPAEQAKVVQPRPTLAPTSVPQSHAVTPVGASPVGRGLAGEPSPQLVHPTADLPLDLAPSSGMSPDIFASRDEEDAYYLSKDLMEQFGDTGYSQPSSSSYQS